MWRPVNVTNDDGLCVVIEDANELGFPNFVLYRREDVKFNSIMNVHGNTAV